MYPHVTQFETRDLSLMNEILLREERRRGSARPRRPRRFLRRRASDAPAVATGLGASAKVV